MPLFPSQCSGQQSSIETYHGEHAVCFREREVGEISDAETVGTFDELGTIHCIFEVEIPPAVEAQAQAQLVSTVEILSPRPAQGARWRFPRLLSSQARAPIASRERSPVEALSYHGEHIVRYAEEEVDAIEKSERKMKRPLLPHLPSFSKRRKWSKDELGVVSLLEDDETANDVGTMRSRVHAESVVVSLTPPTSLSKRFSQLFGLSIGGRVDENGDHDMGSSRLTAGEAADASGSIKLSIKRRRVFLRF